MGIGGKAGDPFAAVTGFTALQSRWHHGEVYALFSYELAKESGEAPADLLNPAPQCFSDTFLLLNAAAVRTNFCCFQCQVPLSCLRWAHWPHCAIEVGENPIKATPTIRAGLVLINSFQLLNMSRTRSPHTHGDSLYQNPKGLAVESPFSVGSPELIAQPWLMECSMLWTGLSQRVYLAYAG